MSTFQRDRICFWSHRFKARISVRESISNRPVSLILSVTVPQLAKKVQENLDLIPRGDALVPSCLRVQLLKQCCLQLVQDGSWNTVALSELLVTHILLKPPRGKLEVPETYASLIPYNDKQKDCLNSGGKIFKPDRSKFHLQGWHG